ncbi:MAG: SDR family oxidoreductase [Bauldia sp.]|nr:SDR family oxidoreductase [Bauldia sp.]
MIASPKVAIVTGAARRIGRAIATDLAANGWSVAILYNHSRNEAEQIAGEIAETGGRAAVFGADLGDVDGLPAVVDGIGTSLGKASLLVNNASMFASDAGGSLDRAQFDRQMAVNLTAPIFLAQAFAAALPDGVEGNVVNLIDQSVWKPTPRHFSYQLSKVALWEATKMLAQSLAPRVRVNAIAPGPTLKHAAQSEAEFAARIETILLRRGPELGEFARTILYFVENRSITGQMIGLDGGQHLAWETPDVAEPDS